MFWMLVELVTEPVGPVEPVVFTVIGPEEKNRTGPAMALPVGALTLTLPPAAGSVTLGVGPVTLGG